MDLFVDLAEDLTKSPLVSEAKEGLSCQVPVLSLGFFLLGTDGVR